MANFLVHKLKIWLIIFIATVSVCLLSLMGFGGHFWWIFDLTSHFRVQYCVILTTFALLFLVGRKYWQTAFAGAFSLLNFFLIVPLSFGGTMVVPEKVSVRVLKINLQDDNTAHGKVQSLIRETASDILLLEEYDKVWREQLEGVLNDYPFSIVSSRNDGWGIGLFSRIPLQTAEVGLIGTSSTPFVEGSMIVEGQSVTLLGSHIQAPVTDVLANTRNIQLAELSGIVRKIKKPVMLLGDLNISLWSPHFADFIETTGLKDTRRGLGLRPTWPTHFSPLLIPIDHCLTSPTVILHSLRLGPDIGSDHYPLIVDFSISPPSPSVLRATRFLGLRTTL